jgi:hypothetical protein
MYFSLFFSYQNLSDKNNHKPSLLHYNFTCCSFFRLLFDDWIVIVAVVICFFLYIYHLLFLSNGFVSSNDILFSPVCLSIDTYFSSIFIYSDSNILDPKDDSQNVPNVLIKFSHDEK